jgi:hypothetical protein
LERILKIRKNEEFRSVTENKHPRAQEAEK